MWPRPARWHSGRSDENRLGKSDEIRAERKGAGVPEKIRSACPCFAQRKMDDRLTESESRGKSHGEVDPFAAFWIESPAGVSGSLQLFVGEPDGRLRSLTLDLGAEGEEILGAGSGESVTEGFSRGKSYPTRQIFSIDS